MANVGHLHAIMEIHSGDVLCTMGPNNGDPILFPDEDTAIAYGDANLGEDWTKEWVVKKVDLTLRVQFEEVESFNG